MVRSNEQRNSTTIQEQLRVILDRIRSMPPEVIVEEFNQVKQSAQEIKRDIDDNLNEVKRTKTIPSIITRDTDKMRKNISVVDLVKQTVVAIQEQKLALPSGESGVVVNKVIQSIGDISTIDALSASFLYEVLEKGLNGELNNSQNLLNVLHSIKNLEYVDKNLFKKIAKDFETEANAIGMNENEKNRFQDILQRLEGQSEKQSSSKSDYQEAMEKMMAHGEDTERFLVGTMQNMESKIQSIVDSEVRAKYQGTTQDENSIKREIEIEAQKRIDESNAVIMSYANLIDYGDPRKGGTPKISPLKRQNYINKLKGLVSKGYLDSGSVDRIEELLDETVSLMESAPPPSRPDSLTQMADQFGIELQQEDQKRLLAALDNPQEFRRYLEDPRFYVNGHFELEKFWQQVRDVCEDVISVVDNHPGAFFEHAFNPMYHGQFYNRFTAALRNAADRLESDPSTRDFAKQTIKYIDLETASDRNQADLNSGTAKKQLVFKVEKESKLSEALSSAVTGWMSEYREVYEYLHDAEKVIKEGMGWETLAKYAEKIKSSSMDWFFLQDKDISKAYGYYIPSLKSTLYLNNRVAIPTINNPDHKFHLDGPQRMALFKMLGDIGTDNPDPDSREIRRLSRRIRMASGAAKAYTFEYWNIWQPIHMPRTVKKVIDQNYPGGYRLAYEFDPAGASGDVDKMKSAIDFEATLRRFWLPRRFPNIPYLFIPRNLGRNAEYVPWNHTMVPEVKKMHEDAYERGASNEYLDFVQKYQTLGEYARHNIMGVFARGAWRTDEYLRFVEMSQDRKTYNFPATISNLMRVGTFPLKTFIDGVKVDLVDDISYKAIMGKDKPSKASKDDTVEFKKKCYEVMIYKRMFNLTPTKVMEFERRENTPFGEKLVREDSWEFLIGKYKGKLHENLIREKLSSLFIEALEIVQKEKAIQFHNQSKNCQSIEQLLNLYGAHSNNPSEGLSAADFKMCEAKLKAFFNVYKMNWSNFNKAEYGGTSLDFLKFEDFINDALPGYLGTLKKSIYKPRKERAYGVKKDNNGDAVVENGQLVLIETKEFKDAKFISLHERLLKLNDLKINHLEFGGEDLDFSEFYLARGGERIVARFTGEGNAMATKAVGNMQKLFEIIGPNLCKKSYKSSKEVEEIAGKEVAPIIAEIGNALGAADAEWGQETVLRHMMYLGRALSKDHDWVKRMTIVGDAVEDWMRRVTKKEGSFYQDFFVSRLDRRTTAFGPDLLQALYTTVFNATDIPWEPENIAKGGYKNVEYDIPIITKLTGRKIKMSMPDIENTEMVDVSLLPIKGMKTIKVPRLFEQYETNHKWPFTNKKIKWYRKIIPDHVENKSNYEYFKTVEGLKVDKKIINRILPILMMIFIFWLINSFMTADKKNKGK